MSGLAQSSCQAETDRLAAHPRLGRVWEQLLRRGRQEPTRPENRWHVMSTTEVKSFCRICIGACGMALTLDENPRIVAVRGDRDHPATSGSLPLNALTPPPPHHTTLPA